jgi:hypothetical protein
MFDLKIFLVGILLLCVKGLSLKTDAPTEASLWLSAAAYCEKSTYLTRTYKGPSSGFVPTYTIYDSKTDTTGYLGYLPSQNTIFVIFRGSVSWQNWASDLNALKTNYTSFPECNCEVHYTLLLILYLSFFLSSFSKGSQRVLQSRAISHLCRCFSSEISASKALLSQSHCHWSFSRGCTCSTHWNGFDQGWHSLQCD